MQAMEIAGRKKHRVKLKSEERAALRSVVDGQGSKERRRRAHILLLADDNRKDGALADASIASVLEATVATVERVRRRYVLDGLEAALGRRPQTNRKPRKLDAEGEATLTMLARSAPPDGCARWTLNLLGERLVELEVVDSISHETVRQVLKKTASSPG